MIEMADVRNSEFERQVAAPKKKLRCVLLTTGGDSAQYAESDLMIEVRTRKAARAKHGLERHKKLLQPHPANLITQSVCTSIT